MYLNRKTAELPIIDFWHYIQRCRDKQMINTYIRAYLTNLTSHFDIIWELRGAHSTSVFSEMEAI